MRNQHDALIEDELLERFEQIFVLLISKESDLDIVQLMSHHSILE